MQVCPCSADDDAVEISALSIACGRRGQMNNLVQGFRFDEL